MNKHFQSAAVAALILTCVPAADAGQAAGQVCLNQKTKQVDAAQTRDWQQRLANSNPQAVQVLVGTWYNETGSPGTGQVSYLYYNYEANGGFTYQNRVCSQRGCNDYSGYGVFAAEMTGSSSIYVAYNISDRSRNSACSAIQMNFADMNTVLGPDGSMAWRRTR
ncbi:hypothetical protein sos41_38170 [Alphaproteobacteria bacterium SO-S41]|nr:hypothetical protein sos41_38170 [Alphaproteobacteria bacterium SO-S41]